MDQSIVKLSVLSLANTAGAINAIAHAMGGLNVVSTDQNNTQSHSAIFRNTTLLNVTISNCILLNCRVTNSSVKNCRLSDCVLENTSIEESETRRCQTLTIPLAFRRFPAEIRSKIFWAALEEHKGESGMTPNLVIALRGDQTLYMEALEAYYHFTGVKLSGRSWENFFQMPPSLFSKIEKLTIDAVSIPKYLPQELKGAKNLRTLVVTFCANLDGPRKGFGVFFDKTSGWKPQIKNLERLVIEYKDDEIFWKTQGLYFAVHDVCRITDNSFGFRGERIEDSRGRPIASIWCAGAGKKLKWTPQ